MTVIDTHFSVTAIPQSDTIFSFIRKNTGYEQARKSVRPKLKNVRKVELALVDVDVGELLRSVLQIIAEFGFAGWQHQGGQSRSYGGFSLTYNPDHQDKIDPHISSIGTPKNLRSEFFWNSTGRHEVLKHSYFDTYGFRRRTPASRLGYLGKFIDSFRFPIIRSRVGVLRGENIDPANKEYQEKEGWHRDEPVFENLRINIPLQTDPSYVFQMEGEEPYHLEVGKAYTWDTNRPHRVFAIKSSDTLRIHLVLGFSPWFNYSSEEDVWFPNEFFGKIHPLDMVAEGYFSKHIRLASRKLD